MNEDDKQGTIQRYRDRYERFGRDARTLGWGKGGRQQLRFSILAAEAIANPDSTVLDVGCGFADLYVYLKEQGWSGQYTGIDLSPDLVQEARKTDPSIEVLEADITDTNTVIKRYDYVIASGVCNHRLAHQDTRGYVLDVIRNCFTLSDVCLCMDFMSSYVDFEAEGAWHTDPRWLIEVTRDLSRRIAIRADYMPYEFAMFLYRDDEVSETNVFKGYSPT